MAFIGDWLFRGNHKRREQIIRRDQELIELMKNNFRVTNDLAEIVRKHLDSTFKPSPITLDEKANVKKNCDVMIERVNEIQAKVEEMNETLKRKMEPSLYEKILNLFLGALDIKKVSNAVKAACHAADVCKVLVTFIIKHKGILGTIITTCAKMAAGFWASIGLGVLSSVILGYIERGELEKELAEYEVTLKEFRPASEEYQDAINQIKLLLK